MENTMKTFTVVDTETQSTKVIKSNATTVAELKRDFVANDINVSGKTIQEALTRIEFKDDNSILPHDVPYKGTVTNNLVFRLTKTNKKIKSGMDRKEIYQKIKEMHLENDIKNAFGKNFTQCSTQDLLKIVEQSDKKVVNMKNTETQQTHDDEVKNIETHDNFTKLCNILYKKNILDDGDMKNLSIVVNVEKNKQIYSSSDLNELLEGLD